MSGAERPVGVLPVGVLLAGGLSMRMGGGDKGLLEIGGRTLLARARDALAPQCADLVLNANGDPARFAALGLPVVADTLPGHPGPLAGVLAGMRWAAARHPGVADVLSLPGDTPFAPADLALRLAAARGGQAIACASSGGRLHPAVALWPVRLADALEAALCCGQRRVRGWAESQGLAVCDFPDAPFDPFLNVNTPEQLAAARRLAETR